MPCTSDMQLQTVVRLCMRMHARVIIICTHVVRRMRTNSHGEQSSSIDVGFDRFNICSSILYWK
jgi:hypothetical protein